MVGQMIKKSYFCIDLLVSFLSGVSHAECKVLSCTFIRIGSMCVELLTASNQQHCVNTNVFFSLYIFVSRKKLFESFPSLCHL